MGRQSALSSIGPAVVLVVCSAVSGIGPVGAVSLVVLLAVTGCGETAEPSVDDVEGSAPAGQPVLGVGGDPPCHLEDAFVVAREVSLMDGLVVGDAVAEEVDQRGGVRWRSA